jgi:excisionase family DNA binding protein
MTRKVPDVFSTHSAARFCRVTPMTIIRWIEEGRIRAYKTPGGHRRIMRADLEDFSRRNGIPFIWEERVENAEVRRLLIVDDDKSTVDAILDAIFDRPTRPRRAPGRSSTRTTPSTPAVW